MFKAIAVAAIISVMTGSNTVQMDHAGKAVPMTGDVTYVCVPEQIPEAKVVFLRSGESARMEDGTVYVMVP